MAMVTKVAGVSHSSFLLKKKIFKAADYREGCKNAPGNKGPKKGMEEKEIIIFCITSKTIAL